MKILVASVYIMGAMLVVLLVALVVGIVWKIKARSEVKIEAPKVVGAGLAPGTAIDSVTLDGDRLAIRAGGEVVIVDVKRGTVLSRVRLFEQ